MRSPGPTATRRGSSDPLRYIVVGTGGWGGYWTRTILPALHASGHAVAVAACDVQPDALRNATEHLGLEATACHLDLDEALDAHDADFVVVATPPQFRETVVGAALDRGLAILAEKPLAHSLESACRIADKVGAADAKMAVTMSHRFDQDKQTLRRLVHSGDYGAPHYVVGRFSYNCRTYGTLGNPRNHDTPDLPVVEGSVHHLDIFRSLTGADGRRVYAETWKPPWAEFVADTTGLATLTMDNGVRGLYEFSFSNASSLNPWGHEYFRVECEDATLVLHRRELHVLRNASGEHVAESAPLPLDERPAWLNLWLAEMFCDWLRGGPAPPNHVEDNLQCAALTFATVESARRGAPVDVQDHLRETLERVRAPSAV